MIIFYFISHWLTHHFGNCGRQSLDLQAFESLQAPETASFLSVVWKGEDTADTYQHVHISLAHISPSLSMFCFYTYTYIYTWYFPKQLLSWMGFQFLLETAFVPSWFAGSSWFRLGFRSLSPFFSLLWFRCLSPFFSLLLFPQDRGCIRSGACLPSSLFFGFWCLSPFFSLLSFLRKGVLFHHDLLAPPGSGWGSGACLPSSLFFSSEKGFCSIMICWFLLVPAGVPVLVSLLLPSFFPQDRGSVPSWFAGSSWFRLGFWCLSPLFSLLWFRCLSPFFSLLSFLRKGVLFDHDLMVPPGSGWGSGACLPSSLFFLSSGQGFCPIMICWFLLVPAGVPVLVSPSSLFLGSGACLPSSHFFLSSGQGVCSIMICWFLLVPAGVPVLVSLLLFFLSSGKGFCSIMIC